MKLLLNRMTDPLYFDHVVHFSKISLPEIGDYTIRSFSWIQYHMYNYYVYSLPEILQPNY